MLFVCRYSSAVFSVRVTDRWPLISSISSLILFISLLASIFSCEFSVCLAFLSIQFFFCNSFQAVW